LDVNQLFSIVVFVPLSPPCLTAGCFGQLEREFLAAQQPKLVVGDKVNRFRADARNRTGGDERSPDLAPMVLRNSNRHHGRSSNRASGRHPFGLYRRIADMQTAFRAVSGRTEWWGGIAMALRADERGDGSLVLDLRV